MPLAWVDKRSNRDRPRKLGRVHALECNGRNPDGSFCNGCYGDGRWEFLPDPGERDDVWDWLDDHLARMRRAIHIKRDNLGSNKPADFLEERTEAQAGFEHALKQWATIDTAKAAIGRRDMARILARVFLHSALGRARKG